MSARRPSAKFPNRCRAWWGASPTAAGCREFATPIGLPLHRSRGLPPHNRDDAAAVPARPGVEESHPPAPVPPASRFGWRRSDEPRAARPARRRSDDACSRAWPDQWDLDRSGHRRGPRGWNNCPRPPATNQSGRSVRASPAAQVHQIPHARPLPIAQAPPARHPRPAPEFLREHLPGNAAAKDEDDARQARAIRNAWSATLWPSWKNRQEGFDKIPQPIWKQRHGHTPFTLLRRRGSGSGGFVTRTKVDHGCLGNGCQTASVLVCAVPE